MAVKNEVRGRELSQSVQYLLYKYKDTSLLPRNHVEEPGVLECACNTSIGKAKTGRFLGLAGQQV